MYRGGQRAERVVWVDMGMGAGNSCLFELTAGRQAWQGSQFVSLRGIKGEADAAAPLHRSGCCCRGWGGCCVPSAAAAAASSSPLLPPA